VGLVAGALLGASVARVAGRWDAASAEERRLRAERAREAAEAAVASAATGGDRAREQATLALQAAVRVAGAAALLRTGEARGRAGEVEPARAAFAAAADALREVAGGAGKDGDALREELARALVGLGEVALARDDPGAARAAFAEAAALPPPGATSRARAAVGLEAALRAGGGASPASALAACRAAVAADPRDLDAVLALTRALVLAGDAAAGRGDGAAALAAYTEAADRGRALDGRPALEVLAGALERLASVTPAGPPGSSGSPGARALEEALRARRTIALRAPDDVRAGRALVRALLGCAARAKDDPRVLDPLPLLDEALAVARQGVARRPDAPEDREILLAALEHDGVARLEAGERARARQELEEALRLARAQAGAQAGAHAAAPARTVVRLALALARLLVAERDLAAARAALEEAATRARGLLDQDARDGAAAGDLVLALVLIASLEQEQGRLMIARGRLREAQVVADAQHGLAPDDVAMRRALALVRWRLAALDLAAGELAPAVTQLEAALELTRGHPGAELDGLEVALEQVRARRQLLEGPPGSPPEALQQAYALLSLGDHAGAVVRFEVAFGDAALRGDMARSHLYNAARAAAQAGVKARALEWLGEDVKRRRERAAALAGAGPEEKAERDRLLRSVEHARKAEPAFAALRGTPEFEALFR
jgi:tetratricopeptide (TPR) repeat protein